MQKFLIAIGLVASCFTGATSSASTERLLFDVGFFQSDVSLDLGKYRSFLNELDKSGIEVKTETLHLVRALSSFFKNSGQEINADLIEKGLRGCEDFNDSCARVIDMQNPGVKWRDKDFAGEIVLPTLILRHDLTVVTHGKAKRLQEIMKQFDQNVVLPTGNPLPIF